MTKEETKDFMSFAVYEYDRDVPRPRKVRTQDSEGK